MIRTSAWLGRWTGPTPWCRRRIALASVSGTWPRCFLSRPDRLSERAIHIVVTGTRGQVATALHQAAAHRQGGIRITLLGRPSLDLARPETLGPTLRQAGPDIVINAAALTAVDAAETAQEEARAVNAVAPGVLATEAAHMGAPILHLSTDYVFDGAQSSPYVETDPPNPQTVYGRTKLAGEQAVAAANPDHLVVRTSWVYGPQGKNFVRTMLRLAETRPRIGVVADQIGNPSYSLDIAEGLIVAAEHLLQGRGAPGLYHMAGTGSTSWAEFATAIFEGAWRRGLPAAEVDPIPSSAYPTPAARPANSRLDCAKLHDVFGVVLPPWRLALERCLDEIHAAVGT